VPARCSQRHGVFELAMGLGPPLLMSLLLRNMETRGQAEAVQEGTGQPDSGGQAWRRQAWGLHPGTARVPRGWMWLMGGSLGGSQSSERGLVFTP
jgi:hypothetical protein